MSRSSVDGGSFAAGGGFGNTPADARSPERVGISGGTVRATNGGASFGIATAGISSVGGVEVLRRGVRVARAGVGGVVGTPDEPSGEICAEPSPPLGGRGASIATKLEVRRSASTGR